MANETVVDNQGAPAADGTANPVPEAGQATPTPTTKADPAQSDAAQSDPALKGEPTGQPAFDVQKSYEELRKQFTKVTQDYSRDRRTWNQTLQELQALKQSQGQLAELLSKATEQPIDPAQFWQDLQSQGPKAMDGYVNKRIQEATKELQTAYVEQANNTLLIEANLESFRRKLDTKNYPDFAELEPLMMEIMDSDDCPVDFNQPTSAIYDALYKLARSRSSENAVKAAEEFGRKAGEEAARKEAATAVPGSGKGGSVTADPRTMSAADLRKMFIAQGMVSEE